MLLQILKRFWVSATICATGVALVSIGLPESQWLTVALARWLTIGGAIIIAIALIVFIREIRKPRKEEKIDNVKPPLEEIKTELVAMNTLLRQIATEKAKQKHSRDTAIKIHNSFIALFGSDTVNFAMSITQQTILNRDIEPLIKMFKNFGDILDSINYGLKQALAGNEKYELCRSSVANKRLEIKGSKRKRRIIQKNIDRVITLIYGLNSSIILRAILRSAPGTSNSLLAPIIIALEGIEAETEKTLNAMLNDLENEWKVTVNINAM